MPEKGIRKMRKKKKNFNVTPLCSLTGTASTVKINPRYAFPISSLLSFLIIDISLWENKLSLNEIMHGLGKMSFKLNIEIVHFHSVCTPT
jgi:hypothetical protein